MWLKSKLQVLVPLLGNTVILGHKMSILHFWKIEKMKFDLKIVYWYDEGKADRTPQTS